MTFHFSTSCLALSSAALFFSQSVLAAPITYEGTATIAPPAGVSNANGFLTDFLNDVPMLGDQVTFSAVFDPSTIGPGTPINAETTGYDGGLTSIEFTIGTTTLSATRSVPGDSGVIVTTADTDQLMVPGFNDGYIISIGSPLADTRWAVNLFFSNALVDLPNTDAPTDLPSIDGFEFVGFGYRSFRDTQFDSFGAFLDTLGEETGGPIDPPIDPPMTVSEPGSFALLFGSLLAMAGLRRRHS